jgi:Fungal protein kinase
MWTKNDAQGTWQFISIARLVDPSSRPHEVSDDLESFFWVLLYEVVRYRNTSEGGLKTEMQTVFDQHTEPNKKTGFVGGGKGKLACLANVELPRKLLRHFVKTPCRKIIEEMRSLFHSLYLQTQVFPSQEQSESEDSEDDDLAQVESAREKLRTSDAFLAIIEKYLASEWSVKNDGSLDPADPRVDPSASRNRKKRPAAEVDDESENIHEARRGRMPPKRQRKSIDILSSQTSFSSSRNHTLFSAPQKLLTSSSAPPSRSLRSGYDQPPPAKQ